jgi:hypothetical protein
MFGRSVSWITKRQKAEGRRQKAEGRRQKAESRKQKAEGRKQKAESRKQNPLLMRRSFVASLLRMTTPRLGRHTSDFALSYFCLLPSAFCLLLSAFSPGFVFARPRVEPDVAEDSADEESSQ